MLTINKDLKVKIDIYTEKYLSYVNKIYNQNSIPYESLENIILTISSIYPSMNNKDKEFYKSILYDLSLMLKKKLEYRISNNTLDISMFSGLGLSAFSIYILNCNTKLLDNFLYSLNNYLVELCLKHIEIIDYNNITCENYDLINGIGGVFIYLLNFDYIDPEKLNCISESLINICKYKNFKNHIVPNFHVKNKYLHNNMYKKMYPSGSINLSTSHGIVVILRALTLYKKKYSISSNELMNETINFLFNLYTYFYSDENSYYFTILSFEQFIGFSKFSDILYRESWCYGSASISHALINSAIDENNVFLEKLYRKRLTNILNRNFQEFNLNEPILCHGYSSLIISIICCQEFHINHNIKSNLYMAIDNLFSMINNMNFTTCDFSFLEGLSGIIFLLNLLINENSTNNEILKYLLLK